MILYPAIDLYEGQAVRLFKGDYNQMTVYNENPLAVAQNFLRCGATHMHMVDLQGARDGTTPNLETVQKIKQQTGLFCEVGGGIRTMEIVDRYLSAGIDRVILGTAAVTDPDFLTAALSKYGEKIAVGIDIKDGRVAIKGWTETSDQDALAFCEKMQKLGVKTVICTDISKDGAMQGTNHSLYQTLSQKFSLQIIASGGVSSIADIKLLAAQNLHGAIIGKAYYSGSLDLAQAIEVAK